MINRGVNVKFWFYNVCILAVLLFILGINLIIFRSMYAENMKIINKLQEVEQKNEELLQELNTMEKTIKLMRQQQEQEKRKNVSLRSKLASRGKSILDFNLREPAYVTSEQLDSVLIGTGLEGLGNAYIEVEREWGVNALFLVALSALESNWGNSNLAKTKNNLFGYGAYTLDPEKAVSFQSREDCINTVGAGIAMDYIEPSGRYYNGGTLQGINRLYASDKGWSGKVAAIMRELDYKIR